VSNKIGLAQEYLHENLTARFTIEACHSAWE
jgi:hypothetical protein